MRIAVFRPGIISNGSAFEAQALIYKFLQKKYGYDFLIIKDEKDNFVDDELNVVSIPTKAYSSFFRLPYVINRYAYNRYVIENIKGYDLIITCDPTIYNQGRLAYEMSRKLNIPYVFDSSVTNLNYKNKYVKKVLSNLLIKYVEQAKAIWITVPKVAERFSNDGIISNEISNNFVVLGHPVDTNLFKPQKKVNDEITLLCISRLVYEKGIHYIIYAVEPLIKLNRKIHLKIVGTGNALSFLKNLAKELDIENNVHFQSPVPHNKLPLLYNSCDIFVSHSVSNSNWEEYFGVASIEAMSCGIPTITSTSGGIPFVIRDIDTANIVTERSIVELTTQLNKLIINSKYREELARKSRDYVEKNYSLEKISEKYHMKLQKIISGG